MASAAAPAPKDPPIPPPIPPNIAPKTVPTPGQIAVPNAEPPNVPTMTESLVQNVKLLSIFTRFCGVSKIWFFGNLGHRITYFSDNVND